ncbi:hypothetical protein [Rhodophyticola sp.]|jgi:hypothetical protein|uniref:hypothetical protein n=1 Tax=Rhodophyticola sp. TaxID=2680032 RepID=UPI003D2A5266
MGEFRSSKGMIEIPNKVYGRSDDRNEARAEGRDIGGLNTFGLALPFEWALVSTRQAKCGSLVT